MQYRFLQNILNTPKPIILFPENTIFKYQNTDYKVSDIISFSKYLPIIQVKIDYIKPALFKESSRLNDLLNDNKSLFHMALLMEHITNTAKVTPHVLLLSNDNKYEIISGHELLIRHLLESRNSFNAKIITTEMMSKIYLQMKSKV